MEQKSVMPMSIPESVYGCLGLLQSSLGKEMARADIASCLSGWYPTEQMAWVRGQTMTHRA